MVTHKERMRRAIFYEPLDRFPTQINYTRAMGGKLAAHFGLPLADLPARLDNHMIRVDITSPARLSEDGRNRFDWWGVGFDTQEEGYFPSFCPLADMTHLDRFPWPDPHDPHLLDEAARIIAADQGEHFITPNFGFALFERAWLLRGFENFLAEIVTDPGLAADLFDRIADIQLALIRRFIALGVDGGYFGDDYGAQKNMLFSPATWRALVKPRLAHLFAPFCEAGLPVLMHSDGQIAKILPDLVEIGLTTLNPVQPEVLDHHWLHDTFDRKLSFYGGVSTQTVLPYGSPDEVKHAVFQTVSVLAPEKTGLVLAPSHRMMADIPIENVEALLEAFAELEGL
jgi:uroporphyrinogen decarboxylase